MNNLALDSSERLVYAGVPDGCDALLLADMARKYGTLLHILRDDSHLSRLRSTLEFFARDIEIISFPSWDCVPYDRISPNVEIVAERVKGLAHMAWGRGQGEKPWIVLATVAAVIQRLPPRETFMRSSLSIRRGGKLDLEVFRLFLTNYGYVRAETVMEPGEYAMRGGIIDLFPPGYDEPLRIDLFGDEIEQIRTFDPMSQRSTGKHEQFTMIPASEVTLNEETITCFRSRYRELFGMVMDDDPLYAAISNGQKFGGMEHWLPLFHPSLDSIFDYLPDAAITLDYQAEEAKESRFLQISEYYDARYATRNLPDRGNPYHPVPPDMMHVTAQEWQRSITIRAGGQISPFAPEENQKKTYDYGGRYGRDFGDVRARTGENLFEAVSSYLNSEMQAGKKILLAGCSEGSADRLVAMLLQHGLNNKIEHFENNNFLANIKPGTIAIACLEIEHGFILRQMLVITEEDILGDRLVRPKKRPRRSGQFLLEASSLGEDDLVVHVDHGIGRYDGLVTIDIQGASHDCLRIIYDGNDKLFVPVENIDRLSRYGSDQSGVLLDRLGSASWQSRKAKLKKRIRDMADQLISIAAQRQLRQSASLSPADGLYDEFCARFPYAETDDQNRAIEECINDLASGRPMDRLICGDVGFGKTEVALRASFVAAMEGLQVAIIVPTTLLARQHFATFKQRFTGFPLNIEQLSRLVPVKQANQIRKEIADGRIDIVIGTQALLAKNIAFKNLGLVIIDEEQHFGVVHKERLKALKADVHVLTMTATPIPRTLQMALNGVREMSIIVSPPIDRLAVRTFVLPYDLVVIREAIIREKFRGGQIFYVCPRLSDMERVRKRIAELVPEVRIVEAHGRLLPTELENVMNAFADGEYDLLLATNIIESGLDMPRVNTIIIHRADMFGLSQLYQLRGRVGRSKTRGYAYLTLPPGQIITKNAEKRLQVMQALDGLGAGFTLASHDLDIRGAGNLLGDEQSGHIKEVGIELYQTLLEEAIHASRSGGKNEKNEEDWSPQIALGISVLIPESYVRDLSVRLGLYRRIGTLNNREEVEAFAAELIDRFGKIPQEVKNLLEVIILKQLCKKAGIEKIDAGPKGAVLAFYDNLFANPAGLISFISKYDPGRIKLRPDHRIVYSNAWDDKDDRLNGIKKMITELVRIAGGDEVPTPPPFSKGEIKRSSPLGKGG